VGIASIRLPLSTTEGDGLTAAPVRARFCVRVLPRARPGTDSGTPTPPSAARTVSLIWFSSDQ
jgi:hypothetical protein